MRSSARAARSFRHQTRNGPKWPPCGGVASSHCLTDNSLHWNSPVRPLWHLGRVMTKHVRTVPRCAAPRFLPGTAHCAVLGGFSTRTESPVLPFSVPPFRPSPGGLSNPIKPDQTQSKDAPPETSNPIKAHQAQSRPIKVDKASKIKNLHQPCLCHPGQTRVNQSKPGLKPTPPGRRGAGSPLRANRRRSMQEVSIGTPEVY